MCGSHGGGCLLFEKILPGCLLKSRLLGLSCGESSSVDLVGGLGSAWLASISADSGVAVLRPHFEKQRCGGRVDKRVESQRQGAWGGDELYQGGSSPLSGRWEVRAAAGLDKSTGTGPGDEGELGRQGQKGGIFHVEWTVFSLEMVMSGIR